MNPRDALAAGIRDLRRIFQRDGMYSQLIRAALQEVVRRNLAAFPEIFGR